jgi:hypothetical protein
MGDETLVVEGVHDGVKALEEGQETGKDKGKVGKVWLEWLLIVSNSIVCVAARLSLQPCKEECPWRYLEPSYPS